MSSGVCSWMLSSRSSRDRFEVAVTSRMAVSAHGLACGPKVCRCSRGCCGSLQADRFYPRGAFLSLGILLCALHWKQSQQGFITQQQGLPLSICPCSNSRSSNSQCQRQVHHQHSWFSHAVAEKPMAGKRVLPHRQRRSAASAVLRSSA